MKKSRFQGKGQLLFWMKVLILVIQTLLFAALWYGYYMSRMPQQYYERGNWAVIGLYFLFLLILNKAFGGLKVGYLKTWDIMYNQVFTVLATNAMMYLVIVLLNGRWAMFRGNVPIFEQVGPMILLSLGDILIFFAWAVWARRMYAVIFPPHEMLLVYGDIDPRGLIRKLVKRKDRYDIRAVISLEKGTDRICEEMLKYQAVMIGDLPSHERNLLIKFGYEHDIRCYGVPKLSDIMIRSADNIELFDTPLLLYQYGGLTMRQRVVKRAVDIICSLILLIPFSVVMLVIAIAIQRYDHGPVFYKQKRLTEGGREFDILKFRSMIVESERTGARLASADDDRITPVGKVIRRLHFDELPQLINILKGDMSIVGPRPERRDIADVYKEEIPEFDFRLKVKAGLTGYAQVYGQYNTSPYDKLKLDLTYIENYSLWMDIKLMFLTGKILFAKEKSEGVDKSKRTAL